MRRSIAGSATCGSADGTQAEAADGVDQRILVAMRFTAGRSRANHRFGEGADQARGRHMRILRRQFAGGHTFLHQAQEHIAEGTAAAHALGFHVRIDRFDDEGVGQPRTRQGAAHEGGDGQPQALAGRLRAAGDAFHDRHFMGHRRVEHLHEQVGLGGEMTVDQAGGDPRLGCHGGHRGVSPAAGGDPFTGCQQDPLAGPGQAFFHQCRAFVGHVLILVSIFEFVFTSFPNPVTLGPRPCRRGPGNHRRQALGASIPHFAAVEPL